MKNIFKGFILGALICTSVYAVVLNASEIAYKNTTVEEAIDDLYSNPSTKKFCKLISGNLGEVSSKYECDPGDGVKRNFYLLANNTNTGVELIMEKNITQGTSKNTMTWYDAMDYIRANNLKTNWKNVIDVNLPSAQTIANAVGNTSWKMAEKDYNGWFHLDKNGNTYGQVLFTGPTHPSEHGWLFNYTLQCEECGCDQGTGLSSTEEYGYWTRDIVANQLDTSARAWRIGRGAVLNSINLDVDVYDGVRPVITVLKSNLYKGN